MQGAMMQESAISLNSFKANIRPILRKSPSAESSVVSLPGVSPLVHQYNALFETVYADTPDLIEKAQRIRFQSYCLDNRFENPADHPGGLERDRLDPRSSHVLLRHRRSGRFIGAVRLIRPEPLAEGADLLMVRASAAQVRAGASRFRSFPFPIEMAGEVSRFSILREARADLAEELGAMAPSVRRQVELHLPMGLIRGIVRKAAEDGLTHWCALMEPALLRLLTRFGIHFQSHGDLVECHGLRQPCWLDIDDMLARVRAERPDVAQIIGRG
jgi:N-acyl amino acid synthase of PEP-CTERM/exosortase system